MSGGPPHHPHNRQVPTANSAWNHLQVPNFFPRPQHAHMSNEHPLLHQPTWHTPTTEPLKTPIQHSHLFNLEQMLSDRPYARHSPGVDLSVTRNGNQNGDLPTTPISLSVRDTNKINSLAASALDIQGTELKALSPGLKSHSPGLNSSSPVLLKSTSPGLKSSSPGLKSLSPGLKITNVTAPTSVVVKASSPILKSQSPAVVENQAKKAKRVDSILERLIPQNNEEKLTPTLVIPEVEKSSSQSVIVQATSSHDENSNSSSILNVPTPNTIREDEVVSPYSNEDSLDSNKSRRKRKPSKTVRVTKEEPVEPPKIESVNIKDEVDNEKKVPERRKSESPEPVARKTRRKTSSESETIDKIAAMVQETSKKTEEPLPKQEEPVEEEKEEIPEVIPPPVTTVITLAQKKDFVAVEDKLEEMFAGLEDPKTPVAVLDDSKPGFNDTEELLNLENTPSTSHDNVTSTSGDVGLQKSGQKKRKAASRRNSEGKKKKIPKRGKLDMNKKITTPKKINGKAKLDSIKDVYAYDSGSNASSSKSRGPYVQIRGPRDSPLSVSVVNTPANDEDTEKKPNKVKKFHDDSEYRHKVRSKGLHCSTLSNKYDAQTKDTSWICVFCKRGPYSGEFNRFDNFYTPGDLFGPYVITDNCPEFDRRIEDPYDKQFKSKKVCRTLEAVVAVKPKKSKRKNSESAVDETSRDFNQGITTMDERSYEIWAHEDCIVWSPGIYLVGPKIVGLEEAVWTCSNVSCSRCSLKGANICCIKRGCPSVVHLGCAYVLNWQMDEDNYKAYCVEHRIV